jgi:hypothetical protein
MSTKQNLLTLLSIAAASCCALTLHSAEAAEESATATSYQRLTVDKLQDDFMFPTITSQNFDRELWKRDPLSRMSMLFDLYHKPLKGMSSVQIYELLGKPLEIEKRHGNICASYDLGLQDGIKTFLLVEFDRRSKLFALSLEQRSDTGFWSLDNTPTWQTTNLNNESLAREYNQQYFVVGMPVGLISKVLGYNPQPNPLKTDNGTSSVDDSIRNTHIFGPFEFEFTPDNAKVQRFRIAYTNNKEQSTFTKWEDKDLRTDARCLTLFSEYFNLKSRPAPLLESLIPFSKDAWGDGSRRLFGIRHAVICSLVRTYPIIGMTRKEVHELLGKPEVTETNLAPGAILNAGAITITDRNGVVGYQLFSSFCGNAGAAFLELMYENDCVTGYRVKHVPGSFCGLPPKVVQGSGFTYHD